MLRSLLAASITLSLTACATGPMPGAMTARGRFDNYGDVDAHAASGPAVASPDQVKVFYGTAPAGFTLRENELKVEPGFNHRIVGTVHAVWNAGACWEGEFTKKDVIAVLRSTAQQAGGNAVIYATSAVSDSTEHVCDEIQGKGGDFGSGWVVVVDPNAAPAPATTAPPAAVTAAPPAAATP